MEEKTITRLNISQLGKELDFTTREGVKYKYINGEMYRHIPAVEEDSAAEIKTITAEYCPSTNNYFPDRDNKIAHQIKTLLTLNGICIVEAEKCSKILANLNILSNVLLNTFPVTLYIDSEGNKYRSMADLALGAKASVNYMIN